MTVHVDELVSEVGAEPGSERPETTVAEPREADDLRAALERLHRDALRTRAEAFDD
jgi:hypothetical protein